MARNDFVIIADAASTFIIPSTGTTSPRPCKYWFFPLLWWFL